MSEFHFLRPLWLLALIPLGALVYALWRRRARGGVWATYCDPALLDYLRVGGEAGGQRALAALAAGWLLAVLALAGPAWERLPVPVYEHSAARVLVVGLDATLRAEDLRPSRLERARLKVRDVLRRSREGRVGLVVFAGEAYTVAPLTRDAATLELQVSVLDPDLLPVPGRRAAPALERAARLLERGASGPGDILLVADGIDDPGAALAAAADIGARHRVSVLQVGAEGGVLEELARAGGGAYSRIAPDGSDLDRVLLPPRDASLDRGGEDLAADRWREAGPWLLLPLLLLGAAGFRRGGPLVVLAVALVPPTGAQAGWWTDLWQNREQQAAAALEGGRPEVAAALAGEPLRRGAALYRAGDFAGAAAAFAEAPPSAGAYNRGNALARAGHLEAALEAYDAALARDPDHADARFNRGLVEALLEQRRRNPSGEGKGGGTPPRSPGEDAAGPSGESAGSEGEGEPGPGDAGGRQGRGAGAQTGETPPDAAPDQAGPPGDGDAEPFSGRPPGAGAPGAGPAEARESRRPATRFQSDSTGASGWDRGGEADAGDSAGAPGEAPPGDATLEAWLERIPEDPGGLLRRKIQLEHLRRRRQGE